MDCGPRKIPYVRDSRRFAYSLRTQFDLTVFRKTKKGGKIIFLKVCISLKNFKMLIMGKRVMHLRCNDKTIRTK